MLCTSFCQCQANNVIGVKAAMQKMRKIAGYFDFSTQAMNKLLEFQRTSDIPIYKDQPMPKNHHKMLRPGGGPHFAAFAI